jgi:deoxycytidylate deaminase
VSESNAIDERPELIFALAGPLGTRLGNLSTQLASELQSLGYEPILIHVSDLLSRFREDWKEPDRTSAEARVQHLQKTANAVRRRLKDGAALARATIIEIRRLRSERSGHPDKPAMGCAFIIYQLKHPEEGRLLRRTYGEAFHFVGGHASRDKRTKEFARMIADSHDRPGEWSRYEAEAIQLIETDDRSEDGFGQNMRDTYPDADVFVDLNPEHGEHAVRRFVDLLFGHPFHTPTPEEYAMYLASAVSLRSSDSNRQVGAVIVNIDANTHGVVRNADVLAVGMNEVPRAGGGFYWDQSSPDARDQALPDDRAAKIKIGILTEIIERFRRQNWLSPHAGNGDDSRLARECLAALKGTQFLNIGEFSRPVHAEMAAIIDAARRGVGIDGCSIYVTTFPCHYCAKHIIAAGLRRVVYLEPYPKSRAEDLYREELISDSPDGKTQDGKVVFCAYSGVAPRQYARLFSMSLRGAKLGLDRRKWNETRTRLQPRYVPRHLQQGYVHAEREALTKLLNVGYDWEVATICP